MVKPRINDNHCINTVRDQILPLETRTYPIIPVSWFTRCFWRCFLLLNFKLHLLSGCRLLLNNLCLCICWNLLHGGNLNCSLTYSNVRNMLIEQQQNSGLGLNVGKFSLEILGMCKPFLPVSQRKPLAANLICLPVWKGCGGLWGGFGDAMQQKALEYCAGKADLIWAGFGEQWRNCGCRWNRRGEKYPTKPLFSGHSI